MINYLKSILPRIQQHSKKLDDTAIFAEIPWGFLDDDGHKVTYIFRRNNELLVSKQGEVATGKWEYLPVLQSLLIEHDGRKRMYNQGFLDESIMLLRKDGTDEIFPLGNVKLLPELDIERYIESSLIREINVGVSPASINKEVPIIYKLSDGGRIRIIKESDEDHDFYEGNKVFKIEGKTGKLSPVPDGAYLLEDGHELISNGGVISKAFLWKKFQTKGFGEMEIRLVHAFFHHSNTFFLREPVEGNRVVSQSAPSNEWISFMEKDFQVKILKGEIIEVRDTTDTVIKNILITVVVLFFLFALYMLLNQ